MRYVDMNFSQLMAAFRAGEITYAEFGDILAAQIINSQTPLITLPES